MHQKCFKFFLHSCQIPLKTKRLIRILVKCFGTPQYWCAHQLLFVEEEMMRMLQKYWMVVMPCRSSVFDISNEILRHLETNIDEVLKELTKNLIVSAHAIPGSPASSNVFEPSMAQLLITATTTAKNRPFV